MAACEEGTNPAALVVVVQSLGNGLRLPQACKRSARFTELGHDRSQLEACVKGLLQRLPGFGQRLENTQRLFEESGCFVAGPARIRMPTRLHPIANCLVGKSGLR